MAYRRTPAVQERLDALRTTLIDSAIGLIARHGYAGCSISAVAAEAGVGTGTVYRHFSNKGELFAEVFRIVCSREVSAAVESGNAARGAEGRCVAAVSASVGTARYAHPPWRTRCSSSPSTRRSTPNASCSASRSATHSRSRSPPPSRPGRSRNRTRR